MTGASSGYIGRPRLLAAVRAGLQRGCVLLEGVAGTGKTVLAARACHVLGVPDAPSVHVRAVAGMDEAALVDALAADHTVDPSGSDGGEDVRGSFAAWSRSVGPRGLVVVDDAHLLDAAVRERLWQVAAEDRARHVRLIVAGRPPMGPVPPRALVHDTVHLIDDVALSWTDDELVAVLDALGIHGWDPDEAPGLAQWPALTRWLAAGRDELVADYLRSEVLSALPPGSGRLVGLFTTVDDTSDDAVARVVDVLGIDRAVPVALRALPPVASLGFAALRAAPWTLATTGDVREGDEPAALRALARLSHERGMTARAGDQAIRGGDAAMLEAVASQALEAVAPVVPLGVLRRWRDSAMLSEPLRTFVTSTIAVLEGRTNERLLESFEWCADQWRAAGDRDREISALFAAAELARRTETRWMLQRLEERVASVGPGDGPLAVLFSGLVRAVRAQVSGDPARALEITDEVAGMAPLGDWSAQFDMTVATNALLLDRVDEAVAAYERAAAVGSDASRATALRLGAFARWAAGERGRALDDVDEAVRLARLAGNPLSEELARASRVFLAVMDGRWDADVDEDTRMVGPSLPVDDRVEELALLERVTAAASAIAGGEPERARAVVDGIGSLPERVVHGTVFLGTLEVALETDRASLWRRLGPARPILQRAVDAGTAARTHLDGGPVPAERFGPFLPPGWGANPGRLWIGLLGRAEVRRAGRVVTERAWARERVRELCAHLVVVDRAARVTRAADLWPDLPADRAAANLRLTLKQLLDVLDPGRTKGAGSGLVDDTGGVMRLSREGGLATDVWELRDQCDRISAGARSGDHAQVLVAGRRILVLTEGGTRLGGGAGADWLDEAQRTLDEVLLRALAAAGRAAESSGEAELAEQLAERALTVDPWSESAGRRLVEARVSLGDIDGARRALARLLERLGELAAPAQPATRELVSRLGRPVRRPVN